MTSLDSKAKKEAALVSLCQLMDWINIRESSCSGVK